MQKTYCDVCGAEIKNDITFNKYEFTIKLPLMPMSLRTTMNFDMCDKCAQKTIDFIERMGVENGTRKGNK